ncbi:MAG: SAM-dependent methyltransferase [Gammaproteobacteria bacterium]|nr:class I SAM-dependent methyltransferase [Gammaproteobacteria bacterium]PCH64482.1 MAG: SAM-dependent methyltransferase [Gammaproteobacteria bacterium]
MSKQTLNLSDELYHYMLSVSLRESDELKALRIETAQDPMAMMQISPEQGQFMALLVKLMSAKNIIEIGTFTGYSSLAMAQSSGDDAHIIACDVNEEWTSVARRYWQQAGVADKIDLRLAPAVDTLDSLLENGREGSFDFAFIDADKTNYQAYYEKCLALIRVGGLIAVDNVLWDGSVVEPEKMDADTVAIRQFNESLRHDNRVDISLVPIADGLTLAMKI